MTQPAGVPRQLFPPPELLGDDVERIVLVEGEPDVVAAYLHGFAAVGIPGTAGWKPEYAARFSGRRWIVYVCFDCDASGRKAASEVAASLVAAGVDARIADLSRSRDDGYDLTDFLLAHGADALRELIDAAEPYAGGMPDRTRPYALPLDEFIAAKSDLFRRRCSATPSRRSWRRSAW